MPVAKVSTGLQSYSGHICIATLTLRKITFEITAAVKEKKKTKTKQLETAINTPIKNIFCVKMEEAMARAAVPTLALIAQLPCHLF